MQIDIMYENANAYIHEYCKIEIYEIYMYIHIF